jgi:hypothetical protein
MIWINCLRSTLVKPRVAQPVISEKNHQTYC